MKKRENKVLEGKIRYVFEGKTQREAHIRPPIPRHVYFNVRSTNEMYALAPHFVPFTRGLMLSSSF